jgi:hypothetical protein
MDAAQDPPATDRAGDDAPDVAAKAVPPPMTAIAATAAVITRFRLSFIPDPFRPFILLGLTGR